MEQLAKIPMDKFILQPITDEESYIKACDLLEELDELEVSSSEDEKKWAFLDALTTLIEAYENKHFAFNKIELSLTEIIEQALDQLNLTQNDLAKMLGSKQPNDFFSGKKELSLGQIRILHKELRIPTDILIGV
jgi:HTH-type transcriptional regulator / antitoxin HigA